MQNNLERCWPVMCLGFVLALHSAPAADLQLGEPPLALKDVSHLPRASSARLVTGGFSVNTFSREQVRSFYNAVYSASDGVPMGSTADTANCVPGTNTLDFREAVLRRINWYRAMAGLPASVSFNSANNWKNQQAALMMSRNNQLSHTPPTWWACWTSDGTNAAANSNIGIGTSGADTVTGYIKDHGTGNAAVGHRRWLLYPQTQVMGTGDVPAQSGYAPANAVWVFDGHYFDPRPGTRTGFISWPPAGYAPVPVVFPRWSISYPGANFSSATLSMLSNGVPVSVVKETVQNGYGENTLVWIPMGLDAYSSSTPWPFNGQDTVYSVTVGNVMVGSTPTNFTYTVTVFDPAVPGPDYAPPVISGPAQPYVGQPNAYVFTAVTNATSYQWRRMQQLPYALNDGAEAGLVNFTAETTAGYSVIATDPVYSGNYSFQFGHLSGSGGTPQMLTLKDTFLVQPNTMLGFQSMLTLAAVIQVAHVQISVNDSDWLDIYTQAGDGSWGESTWSAKSLSLGAYAGSTARIRFRYSVDSQGSYYVGINDYTGWHFDNITINNAMLLNNLVTNSVASTTFQFIPPQAGEYLLQARALIFTDFPLDWGPRKAVTAIASPPVIRAQSIVVSSGSAQIDFTLESGAAASFKLLQANDLSGKWATNNSAVLTTIVPGVSFRFTAPVAGSRTFYRIKTP